MQSSSQSDGISRGIVKFNHPALKTVCPAFDWNRPDHLQGLADETGQPINFMAELDRFPNHAMKESYMRDILRKVTLCASL